MATKAQQIAALVKFLDSPEREEMSLADIAKKIVDDFYKLLLAPVKESPPHLTVGVAFKNVITSKIHHVAWGEGDLYWIISADSRYGYLGSLDPWRPYAMETKAKAGAPGSNADGWQVGDVAQWVRRGWGREKFTILATGDKCVLLRKPDGGIQAEPNDSMSERYKKVEPKPKGLFDD